MRSRIGLLLLLLAATGPFGGGVCPLWAATEGIVIDVGFDGGRQAAAVEPVLVARRGGVDMFSLLAAPNGKGAFHSRGPWLVATYARTEKKFDAFKPFAPTWSTGYILQSRDPIPRYDIAWDDKGGRLVFVAERPLGGTRGLAMVSFVWPAAAQDAAPETCLEIDPLNEHKKRFPVEVISDFWIPTVLIDGATGEYVLAGGGEGSRMWSATSSTGGRTWEHGNVVGRGRAPVVVRSNELLLFWKRILRGNPDEMGAIPEPPTPLYISWGGNSGEWRDGRRIEVAGDRVGLFDACTMGTQSVFLAYVQRQSNTDSVWAVVSPDCGRTWRTPVFVADHVLPESRPSILALEDGAVLVAFSRFAEGRPIVSYTVLEQTNLMAGGEGPVNTEGSYARRTDAALAVARILGDEDPEVRLRSVELLRRLQCETESVIGSLANALGDEAPEVRLAAEAALKEIGGAARSVLLEAMQAPGGTEKKAAATRLFGMLAAGSDVDLLVAALGDKSDGVRSQAAQALYAKGGENVKAALMAGLSDSSPSVRVAAARSLGAMANTDAVDVAQALMKACRDGNPEVRRAAASALTMFDGGSDEAVRALTLLLKDADGEVRKHAAAGLGVRRAASAVPNLVEALGDESEDVKVSAVSALGLIGADARAAVPALCGLARGGSAELRSATLGALAGIKDRAAVPVALGALKDSEERVRREAVSALGAIGFASPEVVKGLCSVLKDKESSVRSAAVQALEELGGKAKAAVPDLIEVMRTDKDLRYLARSAIEEIGDAQSVKMVRDALTNEKNEEVRTSLAGLIKSIEDRPVED